MELKEVDRPCSDVVTDDTTMIDGTTKVKHHRLKDRLLKDDEFRMKCIIWICLCWSFIILVSFFMLVLYYFGKFFMLVFIILVSFFYVGPLLFW